MSSRTAKYVKHTKNPPRTIVSLPMLSQFQETFAIDLKQFLKPLNSLDLLSHLFFRISYNSKQEHQNNCQENIPDIDFKILKTTQTFLTDKGGQLPNKEFLEMTKQLEINSKETAEESVWSNGVSKCINSVLCDMLDKIMTEKNINLEIAIA